VQLTEQSPNETDCLPKDSSVSIPTDIRQRQMDLKSFAEAPDDAMNQQSQRVKAGECIHLVG
jgi:hypothetical protein